MKTNMHISLTKFANATRILKELQTLKKYRLFDQIIVVAVWYPGLKETEILDNDIKVYRIRLKTKNWPKRPAFQFIKYLELIFTMIIKFRKRNVIAINCHSLAALVIGLILKNITGAKLIYDAHELETERHGLTYIRKTISKFAEKFLIKHTDAIIVVSAEINKWYRETYKLSNVYTVENFPYKKWYQDDFSSNFREKFKVDEDNILFIYQGNFTYGRGIEALLYVFSRFDDKKQIVFLGYGVLRDKIIEYSKAFSSIHYHPAVDPKKILYYTQSADVGINLTDNSCLSRYYALSNKLFEYLNSKIPVVISDFPTRAKIIDQYSCGWKIPVKKNIDEKVLFDFISNLSLEEVDKKKEKLKNIKNVFIWEKIEKKYIKAFNLLGINSNQPATPD